MRSIKLRMLAAAAMAASWLAPGHAAAPIPAGEKVAPDPAIRSGVLANGMHFSVMHNATPAKAVSIRLVMDVGSYVEEESERGFAHFIEHMAFRSTKDAPEGVFDERFAPLGIALGRDQNAVTSMLSTVYQVDLPGNDLAGVRTMLQWMRSAADSIQFGPEAVELERGVVLAEKNARQSPSSEMQRAVAQFQAKGLRSAEREPIGTLEALGGATPAALQAFYERWYRPENATLIIVGDAPAAELERLAREAFGSWAGKGAAGKRPTLAGGSTERSAEAFTRSDGNLPTATSMCRVVPGQKDVGASLERMRRETYSLLWGTILNKRLAHAALAPGSPILGAAAFTSREAPDYQGTCLVVLPANGKWKEALALAQGEFRRFAEQGPTEVETTDAVDTARSPLTAQTEQTSTRNSTAVAEQIAAAAQDGRIVASPAEALRVFRLLVADVTAEDLKRAFAADWRGNGPLLVSVAPAAPSSQDLLGAWTDNGKASPLEAYADRETTEWLYWDFGKRGRVAKRERVAKPDFTRITFNNGVVLNFRQTDFEPGAVDIVVRFGHGERGLQKKDRVVASLGTGMFPFGGVGEMSYEDVASALQGSSWLFTMSAQTDAFTLSTSTRSDELEQETQVLAAYMTQPAFRGFIEDKLPTALDMSYRVAGSDPGAVAQNALEKALFPDQLSMPPREEVDRLTAKDFERLLKPALLSAPIEVTVVGDVTQKEATKAVAATFGALPPRPRLQELIGDGPFRRFPQTLPPPAEGAHSGPAEKAAAMMVWPLYVASPERRREEYSIGLVRSIFQAKLLQRVRVKMGKVYSPAVQQQTPDYGDQGYLAAAIETAPADLEAVVEAARAVARELAGGAITQQDVDAAREPAIAGRRPALRNNGAWASVISVAYRQPSAADELFNYEADLKALTLEEVRRAAATWLSADPIIATSRPAQPTATTVTAGR